MGVLVVQAVRRKKMARSRRMATEFYRPWSIVDRWLRIQPARCNKMGLFLNHYSSGKKYKVLHHNGL